MSEAYTMPAILCLQIKSAEIVPSFYLDRETQLQAYAHLYAISCLILYCLSSSYNFCLYINVRSS